MQTFFDVPLCSGIIFCIIVNLGKLKIFGKNIILGGGIFFDGCFTLSSILSLLFRYPLDTTITSFEEIKVRD